MEKRLWLEPDYYENFRCKCGSCRNCCCNGWDIAVSMQEYFRLIGMECSEELHHKLECAFRMPEKPSPQHYRLISPNWLGECPMRDEDGLCMLQKECGESALPEICRVYPRSLKQESRIYQACCSNSCEAIIELLLQEDQLRFHFCEMDVEPEIHCEPATGQLGKTCMLLLQNRNLLLKDRIAQICAAVTGQMPHPDADGSAALHQLVSMFRRLQQDSASLRIFAQDAVRRYSGGDAYQTYRSDVLAFEKFYPDWMRWFENILANHLLYESVPCADERLSPEENMPGLCAVYASLRVICAAACAENHSLQDMIDAIAGIFRMVEHSAFYYNAHILIREPANLLIL